jgi:hypothetical protein
MSSKPATPTDKIPKLIVDELRLPVNDPLRQALVKNFKRFPDSKAARGRKLLEKIEKKLDSVEQEQR